MLFNRCIVAKTLQPLPLIFELYVVGAKTCRPDKSNYFIFAPEKATNLNLSRLKDHIYNTSTQLKIAKKKTKELNCDADINNRRKCPVFARAHSDKLLRGR